MEYLGQPENPHRPVRVPFFPGYTYDREGLADYPERLGWDLDQLADGDLQNRSLEEAISFLQSWLFFGFLTEVFSLYGIHVSVDNFLSTSDGNVDSSNIGIMNIASTTICNPHRCGVSTVFRPPKSPSEEIIPSTYYETNVYVNTTSLTSLLRELHVSKNLLGQVETVNTYIQIVELELSRFAGWWLSAEIQSDPVEIQRIHLSTMPFEVWLSITTVLAAIKSSVVHAEGHRLPQYPDCKYVRARMIEHGWCPQNVARLGITFHSAVTMYYASLLGPPLPSDAHFACSESRCEVNSIDESTYIQRHISTCQQNLYGTWEQDPSMERESDASPQPCGIEEKAWLPDVNQMAHILESGRIPVLELRREMKGNDSFTLEMVPFTPGMRYVAISHVWSNGLGNPNSNTLPPCQIRYLEQCLASEFERRYPYYFWIDTLCVPLKPEEARKRVIKLMKPIYENAQSVLVLDGDLMNRKANMPPLELMMRVTCTSWQTRLWTLQEAIAARKLRFQFRDKSVDFTSMAECLMGEEDKFHMGFERASLNLPHPVQEAAMLFYYNRLLTCNDEDIEDISSPTTVKLASMAFTVRSRTTSKARDEAICLGNILGLDISSIVEAPDERKFQQLLLLQKSISSFVLFMDGPRIEHSPFRWAPSSFLIARSDSQVRKLGPVPEAQVSDQGLLLSLPGIQLLDRLPPSLSMVSVSDSTEGKVYFLKFYKSSLKLTKSDEDDDGDNAEDLQEDFPSSRTKKLYHASNKINNPSPDQPIDFSALLDVCIIMQSPIGGDAAVISECEVKDGIISGRYICAAYSICDPDFSMESLGLGLQLVKHLDEELSLTRGIPGRGLPETQKWLVT
jgi:hypothetical protein